MKFALVNNIRIEATSRALGLCPFCHSEMRGYAGSQKIKHWKHIALRNCDSWYEPETDWHRAWKDKFPSIWQETIIKKDSTKHIADVFNPYKNVVIEFQNSAITSDEIRERERFYNRMIWVVNTIPYSKNILLNKDWSKCFFDRILMPNALKHDKLLKPAYEDIESIKSIIYTRKYEDQDSAKKLFDSFLLLQIGSLQKGLANLIDEIYEKEKYNKSIMRTNVLEQLCKLKYNSDEFKEARKISEEIYELDEKLNKKYGHSSSLNNSGFPKDYYYFDWKHQPKHWNFAEKPIFLDIDNDNIYMVIDILKYGSGFIVKRYFKDDFIKHYSHQVRV